MNSCVSKIDLKNVSLLKGSKFGFLLDYQSNLLTVIYQSFEKGESDYSGFDAFTEEFKTVPEL
jgi:hypothetical protein